MSIDARVSHSSHWGAFTAETRGGRVVGVHPFARDPDPTPLIAGIPGAVHAPSRIDRPYVRRGWLRGDRAGGTLRGAEPFVPVDWDTATRLVAGEIARVRDAHGPGAILGGSYGWSSAGRFHHARTQLHRLLAASGGFTAQVNSYSYAAGQALLPHVIGGTESLIGPVVDWRAIAANARLMVCFGGAPLRNGQVSSGGTGAHEMAGWLRHAVQSGVRLVNVSPLRQDLPGAAWLPIRPGTDAALMLAMAHVLIEEGRVDQDFLLRCTTGFDRLRAYVREQGATPAWAAPITGLDPARIVRLARDCAAVPTMLTAAWSLQRAEFGEQPYWMLIALAAMLGGIGRPGTGFGFGHGSIGGMGAPRPAVPSVGMSPLPNPCDSVIPVARVTEALERPGREYDFNGKRRRYPDLRLIHWAGGNPFHHHQDINRLQRAWARAETIVVHEPWWTATARHADIVLPATTTLERDDIGSGGRDRFVIAMKRAIPPVGQARDDFAILSDIADALGGGVRARFDEGRDVPAWLRFMYDRARTAAAARGVAMPDFDAFWAEGFVELPMPERDAVPFEAFARDPAAHPLATPSGRIELFSETVDGFGYDDCPGHPVWRAPTEYLGAPLAVRYPIHLLTVQPATRLHGQLDQAGESLASKVRGREPILLHAEDAAARGIAEGDVVRAFNGRGACLAGARLTRDLLRGVAVLATGAWYDSETPGEPGALCVHGNPNVLTQDVGTSRLGQGPSAQSCLVEVERWTAPLPPVRAHAPPAIEAP
jgi:biotin/methionine sulfoxide reductase